VKVQVRRVGLIGCGVIGSAFLELARKKHSFIKSYLGIDIRIAALCDLNPKIKRIAGKLGIPFTSKAEDVINNSDIDIVVELIGGLNPAGKYIMSSLRKGKDVVTANKALLAGRGRKIFKTVSETERALGFEASVLGGVPIIKSILDSLQFGGIKQIYGILNGTTNFILTEMSKESESFSSALKSAQAKGFAERDPSLDIKGIDSLNKISVLSFLCFGKLPQPKKILAEGIERISPRDISYARELGFAVKLLSAAKSSNGKVEVRVHPALVPLGHPLAKTDGALNSVFVRTLTGGDFFFSGLGAGGKPTALAVLSDVLNISRKRVPYNFFANSGNNFLFLDKGDLIFRYYFRFSALDKPGVLAKISKILASYRISIASVTQKKSDLSQGKGKIVPIVMLTHAAKESDILKAKAEIDNLSEIREKSQMLRIEEL